MSSETTHATTGTTLWDEFQSIAEEWENDGWLHKYFDDQGRERWTLTALGRRKLGYAELTIEQRRELAQSTLATARVLARASREST
jgi:hypothetical protein